VTSIDRTTQTIALAPYASVRQLETPVLTHRSGEQRDAAAVVHAGAPLDRRDRGVAGMRLPWPRSVRAARQAAHMPAHLSFPAARAHAVHARRSDGRSGSFRRHKPVRSSRGWPGSRRGLSFRRRALPSSRPARTHGGLAQLPPARTKPHATKAQTIKLKLKVKVFGRRAAAAQAAAQREPDGAALALRLVWIGLARACSSSSSSRRS